jgi:hypothetical protein
LLADRLYSKSPANPQQIRCVASKSPATPFDVAQNGQIYSKSIEQMPQNVKWLSHVNVSITVLKIGPKTLEETRFFESDDFKYRRIALKYINYQSFVSNTSMVGDAHQNAFNIQVSRFKT